MIRTTFTVAAMTLAFALGPSPVDARHPDKVVINAAAKKQPAVPFDHAKHLTRVKSCDTCHHNHKGLAADSKTAVVKCTSCHLDPKKPEILSAREMSLTKNPFHVKCIACHKTEKKGPVACAGCHVKK